MKILSLPIILFCLILTSCGPKTSPELEADIQALQQEISELETSNATALQELRKEQEGLDSANQTLQEKKRDLEAELVTLEAEAAKPLPPPVPPEPSFDNYLDEVTMVSGNTVSAKVMEFSDEDITILLDGNEHTGKMGGIAAIRFRSVEPEDL